MLTYAADDFIDVEDCDIEVLQRSLKTLSIEGPGGVAFDVQAYLCLHKDDDRTLCHLAFYCRTLKRSIVFAVIGPESKTELLRQGEECLARLGFEMEKVNLNFGSAMLQVVLRDIPGIQTVAFVDEFRKERAALLARLEREAVPPDENAVEDQSLSESEKLKLQEESAAQRSRAGTAAQRLAGEQRKEKQLQTLREEIERLFSPQETAPVPEDGAVGGRLDQMSDAIRQLEAELDEERSLRKFSEQIKTAAEKRIQELEEALVGYETKEAGSIKESQASAQLSKRINELDKELTEVVARADAERELREQVENAAGEVSRQNERLDAELAEALEQTADLLASNEVAMRNLEELREQLTALEQKSEQTEQQLKQACEAGREAEKSSQRLDELRQEIASVNERCEAEVSSSAALRTELDAARDEIAVLKKTLAEYEAGDATKMAADGHDRASVAEVEVLQADLDAALASATELSSARDELSLELDEANLRIRTLEKRLEQADAESPTVKSQDETTMSSAQFEKELGELRGRLVQAENEKQQAEKQLTRAEVRIEILEEELEKSRSRAPVQVDAQAGAMESAPPGAEGDGREAAVPGKKNVASPHVLRKPPAKGAFFHVNWDLEALPCDSTAEILDAWKSVYNVQLTLEGYPSQYCSGALVVLKEGQGKRLFMMFHLKDGKRTLVYEPGIKPKDAQAFKKALEEARKFMMLSGIEFDKVSADELERALKSYLP